MAVTAGVSGDVTNKSGRVTAVTRMSIAGVPKPTMAQITGHRSLSSLDKYDRTGDLDTQAAQFASRNPYIVDDNSLPQHVKFDLVKERVSQRYHTDQVGSSQLSSENDMTLQSEKHVSFTTYLVMDL